MRQALSAALCALALVCGSARAATVTLDWDANAEADLAGYRVYYATNSLLSATTAQAAANTAVTKVTLAGTATTYALSLSYGATYFFRLTAYDASSNESAFNVSSTTLLDVEASTRTPSAPTVDTSSPTVPTSLAASGVSTSAFTLGWTASTDNVGVTGYRLDLSTNSSFSSFLGGYRNFELGNATAAPVSGLAPQTTYYVRLKAYDAAGNESLFSAQLGVVTLPPAPASPAALFQEDFEDGSLSSRGWYDNTSMVLTASERYSGSNSVEFRFLPGATTPTSGGGIRHLFTATDEVYVSYYVKYSTNWTGSNQAYHPHEFLLLTNENGAWQGPSSSRLTAYIEQNEGTPLLSIQDSQNIDTTNVNVDLTAVTENRAVSGCNGTSNSGYSLVDCYPNGGSYRNGTDWRAGGVYFQDAPGAYDKNAWHHVEAYFKLNSIAGGKGVTDGKLRYWFDGVLIISRDDAIMHTGQYPNMKFNQFIIAPYIGDGSPVDQTMWVDNLVLATSRSAPDISSPTVPSNPATTNVSSAAFNLTWGASTDDAGVTGYRLDVSTVSGFTVLLAGYNNKDLGNATSAAITGLSAATTHYARLRAYDAAGNVSVNSVTASTVTLTPPDTTNPSAPANPVLSGATTSTLSLSWTAATDNVGVTGYRLDVSTVSGFAVLLAGYNNKDVGSATSAAITGLSAATTHYARLRAYDAAGNTSANSVTASTMTLTPPDTTNPSAPASPVLSGATTTTLSLSWTAATDNVGVTGYRVDVSLSAGFAVLLAGYSNKDLGSVTSAAIAGLSAATTHYARLRAYDAAGNISANSVTASTMTLTPPDTTNPSAPASPVLSGATTSTLNLSWTAAADNVGVTGYRLDVSTVSGFAVLLAGYNNKVVGNATSAAIAGLSAATTHYARLRAYDAAGNVSANSVTASARTSSAALLIEPGGQAGWGTGTINAALDDVKVRVRVVSGAAAVVSARLFYEEVGGGASRQIMMSLSTAVAQSYEAVLPSTHTALKAGWLRLRAELTDADGGVAQSSWEVRVAPEARSAPDASARVLLPHRAGAGLPASADFGQMPASARPGIVDLRLLAAAEAPRASGEQEIDASGSSSPLAVYELKADDRASSVFPAPVQLALAYPDVDGDGLVDGTAIRAMRLRAFWHDGIRWRLVGGSVDETARLVRVPTMHFSSFALFPASVEALAGTGAEVKAAERFITPVPQDGFNDVATFGLGAREVEIFDMAGRSVFRATGGGTAAIVWTGRDGSGRVVGSGAYVARIGDFGGGKQYQVIVVAK